MSRGGLDNVSYFIIHVVSLSMTTLFVFHCDFKKLTLNNLLKGIEDAKYDNEFTLYTTANFPRLSLDFYLAVHLFRRIMA